MTISFPVFVLLLLVILSTIMAFRENVLKGIYRLILLGVFVRLVIYLSSMSSQWN